MAQKENTVMASIIFASVALLYTASTVNARIGSDNSISCSTSDSSPYLEHAEETVNAIRKLPEDQQCCQLRDPSGCTEMASWFTSKVNICGKKGCTTCRKAGEALNQVLAQCPRRDSNDQTRVEGTNEVDGFTVNIYRGDVLTSDDSSVKCSTSDSSPFLANAETTVNAIRKLPEDQQCCQLKEPSGCTEMAAWLTSKVDICGEKGCTTCRKAGEALNQVLAQCPKRDTNDETRVEGEIKEDGFTFKIALNVLDTGKIKLAEYV